MNTLGGRWRFSRFPNFFTSGIVAGKPEFSIFDSVIKKCSSDFGHESLREKFTALSGWELAKAYQVATAEQREVLDAVFTGLNRYLGNYIGEFLGELSISIFFLLAAVAMLRTGSTFPR